MKVSIIIPGALLISNISGKAFKSQKNFEKNYYIDRKATLLNEINILGSQDKNHQQYLKIMKIIINLSLFIMSMNFIFIQM